jgi:roadblock/LC7 domain-containing protein
MSKLIGTDPNQVPSNADLGSAAFMDKKEFLLSKGSDISAIDAVIPKTAVDVFIYDTSKDSDGGAWRKRTQHTSWYNERLNTPTRGSRKEFPVVAVIVAESDKLTIYDGNDPNLPMWMVFNQGGTWSSSANLIMPTTPDPVSVSFLNGILSVAYSNGYGVGILDFISESKTTIFANNVTSYNGNISQRNNGVGHSNATDARRIVNSAVNDVAMTVLPNAPIDAATGLPVPTIAVATNGGVSVIKDDGTVISTVSDTGYKVHNIDLQANGNLFAVLSNSSNANYSVVWAENYTGISGLSWSTYINWNSIGGFYYASVYGSNLTYIGGNTGGTINDLSANAIGSFYGLTKTDKNPSDFDAGLVNFISSTYNTGWMNGDIKLATLSDTDDTDVSATNTEFLTGNDSSFTSGLGNWQGFNATLSIVNNALRVADNGGYSTAYQTITTVVGKQYVFSAIVSNNGNFATISAGSIAPAGNAWGSYGSTRTQSNGTFTFTFTATATTTYLILGSEGSTSTDYDSLSLKEAEEDRSVNGNGLQVFGTVTKTPVAAGADLVAYSGWSTSNKLIQPHNSYMNFGTGDIAMMGWLYLTTYQYSGIAEYANPGLDANGSVLLFLNNDGQIRLLTRSDGGGWNDFYSGTVFSKNGWNHLCALRRSGGTKEIYFNGNLVATGSDGGVNVTNSINNTEFSLGHRIDGSSSGQPLTGGSISLFRVSATTPSADQIKKMYEDEKVLFQENAKCTLYGSSDAVTALAYDDTTELLHVGTSAGRSVFQGLRRIDNTTDAVGAAISASNGMVAED